MGSRPLRRLDQPRPISVVVSPTGLPHAVVFRGRRRPVVAVRDDWLVQDRWWTDTPVDRHYYELVIDPGRHIVIFLDLRDRAWFAHHQENPTPARRTDASGRHPRHTAHRRP